MTTINDVAKRAGVSSATVSYVINKKAKISEKTTERVLKAINELNYIPNNAAKGLKMSITRTIGILAEDISAFLAPEIIDGICKQSEADNYQISLCNLHVHGKINKYMHDYKQMDKSKEFSDSIRRSVNTLLSSPVCGLIYIGEHPRDISGLLPKLDIPVVYTYCFSKSDDSFKTKSIHYDDIQGAKLAVEHLISSGHSKIAVICGADGSYSTCKRLIGYKTALAEKNLPLYDDYIVSGDWSVESGHRQTDKLFSLAMPPTAIFSMNDLMAFGSVRAINKRGLKVPDDISVHGFDNMNFSQFMTPALTTIALPLHEMGRKAAECIIKMVENHGLNDDNEIDAGLEMIKCRHLSRGSVKQFDF